MVYDGKTYRNLQDQVAYLTSMYKALGERIEEVAAQIPSKMIVEELPEEGDPLITYYVGPKGTEPNLYYEVWIWVQEEPEGPFVWRELEDTDQVDLSGYLQKDTTPASPYNKKVYGVTDTGEQVMITVSGSNTAGHIPVYVGNGQLNVNAPTLYTQAANKKYVDDNFVEKDVSGSAYSQLYGKTTGGVQTLFNASENPVSDTIPIRFAYGHLKLPNQTTYPPTDDDYAVSKRYTNDNFLAKQTGTSSYLQAYAKFQNGSQGMVSMSPQVTGAGFIVLRDTDGQINVPTTPTDNNHAASKQYVDATVGQLLYLHDIEIIVTVDSTNKLYIKAYLINGSATAITSIDSATFKRMDVQYGCFGVDVDAGTPCAVIKKPDYFVYRDFTDPSPSYLYQYISGGTLQAYTTTNSMAVTVTDTVISF